jgi:hypothetical protein
LCYKPKASITAVTDKSQKQGFVVRKASITAVEPKASITAVADNKKKAPITGLKYN